MKLFLGIIKMKIIYINVQLLLIGIYLTVCNTEKGVKHRECLLSPRGFEYVGHKTETSGGRTCQRWDSTVHHSHNLADSLFPGKNKTLSQNYCRNPDGEKRPWCYTTDRNKRWEYCDIKKCVLNVSGKQCLMSSQGFEYMGHKNKTQRGLSCQRWDSQKPHKHTRTNSEFPELNMSAAENYCRNPDGMGRPWCYTTDPKKRWDYCTIPECTRMKHIKGYTGWQNTHIKGLNLQVYSNVSLQQCAHRCSKYWVTYNKLSCVSFDYNRHKSTCFLSDRNRETVPPKSTLSFALGIDHYERNGVGICDIAVNERRSCGDVGKETCLNLGCCYRKWKCYMSKSSMPNELHCNADCRSVIMHSIKTMNTDHHNEMYVNASLEEAIKLVPEIPRTFWTWLRGDRYVKEAIFAVKWPVDPRLIRNLYDLYTVYDDQISHNPDLYIGVSYAMMNVGVKNRANTNYHLYKDGFIPKHVNPMEGLTTEEIAKIRAEEDTSAQEALYNTAVQELQTYLEMQEAKDPCARDHTQKWQLMYKQGDKKHCTCEQLARFKNTFDVEDCMRHACVLRGNAFNYKDKLCYIKYCYKGELTYNKYDWNVYVYRDKLPVCQMVEVSKGPQLKEQFRILDEVTADVCKKECRIRGACLTITYDKQDKKCYLYDENEKMVNSAGVRYMYMIKKCNKNVGKADDPNSVGVMKKYTKLHSAAENKMSTCYQHLKKETKKDLKSCLTVAVIRKANLVLYNHHTNECQLRRCYTSNLGIQPTKPGKGFDIYQDKSLMFVEGKPAIKWVREHSSFVHANMWTKFASSWANQCKLRNPGKLPFPPREDRMNGYDFVHYIETMRLDLWDFPTISSPWPIISFTWPESSKRACNYVWSQVHSGIKPKFYSTYTRIYAKRKCDPGNWFPNTIPRMIIDGGVCGRQSYLEEQSRRCLGQPAFGIRQPRHRAAAYIKYEHVSEDDPLAGPYRLSLSQSIIKSNFYSMSIETEHSMLSPTGRDEIDTYIPVEYYVGLAASMNQGISSFTKAQIAMAMHNRAPQHMKDKALILIVHALKRNPYMVNVWQYLLNYVSGFKFNWGNGDNPYVFNNRFATKICPTGTTYEAQRIPLWNLAKKKLRRHVSMSSSYDVMTGFPVTYTDIALRLFAPAVCCKNKARAIEVLKELQNEADSNVHLHFEDYYNFYEVDRFLRQNMALCKAFSGGSWHEILEYLFPVIEHTAKLNGRLWGKGRMTAIVKFISMIQKLTRKGKNDNDTEELIEYFEHAIMPSVVKIHVNNTNWDISAEYKVLLQFMEKQCKNKNDKDCLKELENERKGLIDRKHGSDKDWWMEMIDIGIVKGKYKDIYTGKKVWDGKNFIQKRRPKRSIRLKAHQGDQYPTLKELQELGLI